jgi:hypothetical protein
MPISSAEIAQLAMMNYQQTSMMRSAFNASDMLGGTALNAMSTAGPLAMGAMGMMGIDPMSLGLRAGMASFGKLGLAGAAGVGIGTAAAAAVPMMAAGYGMHQMMSGAGEQQALNATLGRSFNFFNAQGGRGFNRGDTLGIGMAMREMSHEVGPGGELTSMRELTEVAGKMGQMGLGKGVRDAKEFNQKFRELVKTVKEVATELNTSLGQALEFMNASRASGMFSTADQARFAKTVQSTAVGSGLATSEVTAMANIGSQVSRSFGGLGRQGAMGGMRAIGQVGAAMQAGVLSEEDIYNATGLTGDQGRQAFATNAMAQTGSFLKSGKGRWFMASLAGMDGTLDEDAVQRYMSGNVGVGETRGMARKHLGEVGRANFIRNEGRLRGAVMERFGATAPAMALMGWASQKGIDINNMDDRSMLFAQRHLGMGRDELDAAIKMAGNLPQIARQQLNTQRDADFTKTWGMDLKEQGIEGMQRRFEHAKEKINSKMREAGQVFYHETVSYIDSWINKLVGHTIDATTENLPALFRATMQGGAGAASLSKTLFGGAFSQNASERQAFAKSARFGEGKSISWNEFSGGDSVLKGTGLDSIFGIGRNKARLESQGFKFDDIAQMSGAEQERALSARLNNIQNVQSFLANGSFGTMDMDSKTQASLTKAYTENALRNAKLGERAGVLRTKLQEMASGGDAGAKQLLEQMNSAGGPAGEAAFMARVEKTIGKDVGGVQDLAKSMGGIQGMLLSRGQFGTVEEGDKEIGARIFGRKQASGGFLGQALTDAAIGAGTGAAVGVAGLGIGAGAGAAVGGLIGFGFGVAKHTWGGGAERSRREIEAGSFLRSKEGLSLVERAASGDASAFGEANRMLLNRKPGEELTGAEAVAANISMRQRIAEEMQAGGVTNASELSSNAKQRLVDSARSLGLKDVEDFEHLGRMVDQTMQAGMETQRANRDKAVKMMTESSKQSIAGGVKAGVLTGVVDRVTGAYGSVELSKASAAEIAKLGSSARAAADNFIQVQNDLAKAQRLKASGREEDLQAAYKLENDAGSRMQRQRDILMGNTSEGGPMSISELDALSKSMRGTGEVGSEMFDALAGSARQLKSLGKTGAGVGIARFLGASLSRKEQQQFNQSFKGDREKYMDMLAGKLGLEGGTKEDFLKNDDIRKAIETASSKGLDQTQTAGLLSSAAGSETALGKKLQQVRESKQDPQTRMASDIKEMNAAMKDLAKNLTPASITSAFGTQGDRLVDAIGKLKT